MAPCVALQTLGCSQQTASQETFQISGENQAKVTGSRTLRGQVARPVRMGIVDFFSHWGSDL